MCRYLAYLGAPIRLSTLISEPDNSLLRQSTAPRFQTFGDGNPDGWGAAWTTRDGVERHRVVEPMHLDPLAETIAGEVSGAFLAAIRLATPGMTIGIENTAPYLSAQRWFAHNGAVARWNEGGRDAIASLASPPRIAGMQGSTDSELLFAAVLSAIDTGFAPPEALARVVRDVDARVPESTLNLVLMDDHRIVASVWGNSLFHRIVETGTVIASEPFDDDPSWRRIPDRSMAIADASGVRVAALELPERTR